MKNLVNHIRTLFLACLTLFASQSYAGETGETGKSEMYPGYIITKTGKRVEGKLKIGSITDQEVKVVFYEKGTSKKKTYKPKDILGYGYFKKTADELGIEYSEEKVFESHKMDAPPKPFASTTVFVEKEISGEIDLYCYYIESRSNVKNPYKYSFYTKDEDGSLVPIEENKFIQKARKMFGQYSALTQRLGQKDFRYRNLTRMVRDYNYWATNQHDSSEYRVAMKNQ